MRGPAPTVAGVSGDLPVTVVRTGDGPEVVLVHGGAGPTATWAGLESLRARWTLAAVYRRGFAPSPDPVGGGQDFEVDAEDLAAVFGTARPHVVAHSYGTLGTLIAAGRRPESVRSHRVSPTGWNASSPPCEVSVRRWRAGRPRGRCRGGSGPAHRVSVRGWRRDRSTASTAW
ncbi:alpha/beta fold hydrolase [Nocardia crassostreae]|uniref:alpha/beta fold hydrolase n=1 Tax=Nocardia crassostreae TaxID=53428 RepID=UPI0012F8D627|nr:alpha/beta hydrolase [Nocardia crassostreae]